MTVAESGSAAMSTIQTEASAYSKVNWRLMPFLFICYIFCFLDRVNVGFAKLQMQQQLGFSETIYGLGAGIFFIGYFIFEIPSNLLLEKVGPRRWIGRIMITWGLVSALTMFVNSAGTFYLCRFILGVMEAGFFPGIILYFTYWYPASRRAHTTALFLTAIPVSGVIGGPLSGWILESFSGTYGLAGWQWLFVLEGIPSLVMGIITLWYLDDGIDSAKWLTQDEKQVLKHHIAVEKQEKSRHSLRDGLLDWRVWLFGFVYFCFVAGLYGISFWLPQMIKSSGVQNALYIGLLTAIPNAVAIVGMLWIGRSSDKTLERRWHTLICAIVAGLGLGFSAAFGSSTTIAVVAVTVGLVGIMACLSIFWSVPTAILAGTAAAGGIALVNSMGNLSGFVSPYMLGYIKDATKSLSLGLYALGVLVIIGGILVMFFAHQRGNQR
ncbi:MAG TPA: MFS transporter [Desulfomonilaceae bacterium]|nr:MFS transporter [Desulfomonilaceae bacterium]